FLIQKSVENEKNVTVKQAEQIKIKVVQNDLFFTLPYWPGEDQYGHATATGAIATEGVTVAVDPTVIPYGTVLVINGHEYVAQDCGGEVQENVIDIFVEQPYMQSYNAEVFVKE
ncbi:3D (Asp-Asp-Asp) domain-containing protein, partial [Breznakia sp. PFB2-30]|uniref:3D domain-containing protein n=1 Tax=unclassified Breznakia TaxID=2623764 RepID=UPI002474AFE9